MEHLTVHEMMRNAQAVCGGDTARASRFLAKNRDVQDQRRLAICHDLDDPVLLAGVVHHFERVGQSVFLCPRLTSTPIDSAAAEQLQGAAWAVCITLDDADVLINPPEPIKALQALVGDRLAWMPLRDAEPYKAQQWIKWGEESGRAFVVTDSSRVTAIQQYASDYRRTNSMHLDVLGAYTGASCHSLLAHDPS